MATATEEVAQTLKFDNLYMGLPFDAARCRPGSDAASGYPTYAGGRPAFSMTSALETASAMLAGAGVKEPVPVSEMSDDRLDDDSRQVTPMFIPGIQDHYTGLRELPAVAPPSKAQQLAMAPPPGLEEACKAPVEKEADDKDVEIARLDTKKLESLIWLYLHTSKGDEGPAGSDVEPMPSTAEASVSSASDDASPQSVSSPSSESEECPPPPLSAVDGAAFSCGSVGHPEACQEACKYARKKRGCKDGLTCTRCHLCTWYHKRNA